MTQMRDRNDMRSAQRAVQQCTKKSTELCAARKKNDARNDWAFQNPQRPEELNEKTKINHHRESRTHRTRNRRRKWMGGGSATHHVVSGGQKARTVLTRSQAGWERHTIRRRAAPAEQYFFCFVTSYNFCVSVSCAGKFTSLHQAPSVSKRLRVNFMKHNAHSPSTHC